MPKEEKKKKQPPKEKHGSPDAVITKLEEGDAYDANDMTPPYDEAPVTAGGGSSQNDKP